MKRSIFFTTLFTLLITFKSSAAIISVGGYDIEDYKFADSVVLVSGSSNRPASNAEGYNFDSFITIDNTDLLSFTFIDNFIFNGTGIDLLVFELAGLIENSLLSMSVGGNQLSGLYLGTDSSLGTQYQVNIFGFDLSDFGIAEGQSITDSMFMSPSSNNPDIAAFAAINSYTFDEFSNINSVPAPAPLGIMSLFLIVLILNSRKRIL